MSVYVIIEIKVKNKDMYQEYIRKVPPIVKSFGGEYVVRGGKITNILGDWTPERVILLKFENTQQVQNWLTSPEYAEVAYLRENSTISNAIMIESGVLP